MVDKSMFSYSKGQIAAKAEVLSAQSRSLLAGMGMSQRGIQQLSLNQQITDPQDRMLLTVMVQEALK